MLGLGNNLNELKIRIQKLQQEIVELGEPNIPIENMIDSTNLIRQNEYLEKLHIKQVDLIAAYAEYAKHLEHIVSSLFSIQAELKNLVKEEISIIKSETKPKKSRKTSKKST